MPKIISLTFNLFRENTYIVDFGDGTCAIIDPGAQDENERHILSDALGILRPLAILITHGHPDHTMGLDSLLSRYPGTPVYLNSADSDKTFPTLDARDSESIKVGNDTFTVIATPGHTPGSVCYLLGEKDLFTGDTLFEGTIGRTDLTGGDYDVLMASIMDRLMPLDGDIRIFPGHGPSSTIAAERANNPFLQPFDLEGGQEFDEDANPIEINPFR